MHLIRGNTHTHDALRVGRLPVCCVSIHFHSQDVLIWWELRSARDMNCNSFRVCFCWRGTPVPFRQNSFFTNKKDSNLVDSASSHTLVSKIKPCMSKYKRLYTVKLRMAH